MVAKDGLRVVEELFSKDWRTTGPTLPFSDAVLLPPVAPSKVVAVGRNFFRPVAAGSRASEPGLFIKGAWTVAGPGSSILVPDLVEHVQAGAELGVVIGRAASGVEPEAVMGHVLGYTGVNDVTAVDFMSDRDLCRAKSLPTFCPIGPAVARLDPSRGIHLRTRINGRVRQEGSTLDLLWTVAEVVSFVSRYFPLTAGDLVAMGSPPPNPPLQPGDVVEVDIEGIGVLRNRVLRASHHGPTDR